MAETDPGRLGSRAARDGGDHRRDQLPLTGGVVVITRFECPGLWALLLIMVRHRRMRKDVRRQAHGYLGVAMVVRLRERTLLSISLWQDLESLHSMGRVQRHVDATRLPARLGVVTSGGVYPFAGDWRQVMFASPRPGRPPLRPVPRRTP